MKQLLYNVLTKTHNLTESELDNLLFEKDADGKVTDKVNEAAANVLIERDAQRVKSWKDKQTDSMTRQANELTAKINGSWEKALGENFTFTTDKKGDEFLAAFKDHLSAMNAGKKDLAKPEDVKRTPTYLELEASIKNNYVPKPDYEKAVNEFTTYKTTQERSGRINIALHKGGEILQGLSLVKHEVPTIQENITRAFNSALQSRFDDVEITQDGKIYPIKDGKRIENQNGHAVDYTEIVRETALGFWAEAKQAATGNAGNKNEPGAGGGGTDWESRIKAEPDFNKKTALYQQWEAEKIAAAKK